jgi:myo-inositol-1(or 4)-monophosphatase
VGLALDGEALVGVNYDPMCNEMFHAERGKGAFLNDDLIHVSDRPNLSKSVVGFDLSYAGGDGASNGLQVIQAMLNDVGSTRTWGRRRGNILRRRWAVRHILQPPIGTLGPGGACS